MRAGHPRGIRRLALIAVLAVALAGSSCTPANGTLVSMGDSIAFDGREPVQGELERAGGLTFQPFANQWTWGPFSALGDNVAIPASVTAHWLPGSVAYNRAVERLSAAPPGTPRIVNLSIGGFDLFVWLLANPDSHGSQAWLDLVAQVKANRRATISALLTQFPDVIVLLHPLVVMNPLESWAGDENTDTCWEVGVAMGVTDPYVFYNALAADDLQLTLEHPGSVVQPPGAWTMFGNPAALDLMRDCVHRSAAGHAVESAIYAAAALEALAARSQAAVTPGG